MAWMLLYGGQPHERQHSMSEKKIEIKGPNLPLDPIVGEADPEYPEIKAAHDALLAEFKRLDEIRSSQVEGASWSLNKDKRIYSVEEYNEMLAAYRAVRKAYVGRYREKLETIDMVREKIRKISEELERYEAENPAQEVDIEASDVPDFEEIPNEPFAAWRKRMKEHWDKVMKDSDRISKSCGQICERIGFIVGKIREQLQEKGKFEELEYELEFRLRHTYINPKTDEQEYRPDDDVGEGLICVGSRDYNPKREDFDD